MTIKIQSLFVKIFLWFWATAIATGIALIVTWILLQPKHAPSQSENNLADTAWVSVTSAVDALERQGQAAASEYMGQLSQKTHLKSCLFDASGNVLAGNNCPSFDDMGARAMPSDVPAFNMKFGLLRVAIKVRGKSGHEYIYAVQSTEHRGPPPGIGLSGIALRWSVPFLVSGLICYLLARYLTTPILRLREASQQLALGNFSTRAAAGMEHRRDELGTLVRDFNSMAVRIEELISRQRQLIYDISHELRSPLSRLNVALDLGRQRKGNDSAFDHMEQDIELMGEMIGRMLTVAKLDTSTAPVEMTRIDLGELVSRIVRSAEFELRERDDAVRLTMLGRCFVRGNAELLQSAIENVIRNAVRYTPPDASVDVHLGHLEKTDDSFIVLSVRDYGVGVPESELSNIFTPFHRVASDRDRQAGGVGLGLAVGDRVIRVHGGTIRAQNASPQGLCVAISLPSADTDQDGSS